MANAEAPVRGGFMHRLVLEREDPTALGLLRIVLVTVFTLALLAHVGAVGEYFSDESMINGRFARLSFHSRWSLFFYVQDPTAVRAIFALGVVAHLMWLTGLYTRPAAIIAWVVWLSLMGRNPMLYAFPDQLLMALVTWMMMLPSGRGLSLDAKWRGKGGPVPVWCRRIIQLQFAVLYGKAATTKTGETWSEGTATYFALLSPYNRHFELGSLAANLQPWLLKPATYVVMVWQYVFAPFVVLNWLREMYAPERKLLHLRKIVLGYGVAFHGLIQLLLYVVWFSALCIFGYAAFLSPAEARRIVERFERLAGKIRGRRSPTAA